MNKLPVYELANLAAWSFDFQVASHLFRKVASDSVSANDLLGALGAVEGTVVSQEMVPENWRVLPPKHGKGKKTLEAIESTLAVAESPAGYDDRNRRLQSVIRTTALEITKNVQDHKLYLRNRKVSDLPSEDTERAIGDLTTYDYGKWFIAVQRLATFCLGRAYRRDGLVAELILFQQLSRHEGLTIKQADARCVQVRLESINVEVWFDGRVCCITIPDDHEKIGHSLERVADLCNQTYRGTL